MFAPDEGEPWVAIGIVFVFVFVFVVVDVDGCIDDEEGEVEEDGWSDVVEIISLNWQGVSSVKLTYCFLEREKGEDRKERIR